MKNLLLLTILTLLISCGQSESDPPIGIEGFWKLDEICFSPGDQSLICNDAEFVEIFQFKDEVNFELTSDGITCDGKYTLINEIGNQTLSFSDVDGSCDRLDASYTISLSTENDLHINRIGCIEPCIWKYVKN